MMTHDVTYTLEACYFCIYTVVKPFLFIRIYYTCIRMFHTRNIQQHTYVYTCIYIYIVMYQGYHYFPEMIYSLNFLYRYYYVHICIHHQFNHDCNNHYAMSCIPITCIYIGHQSLYPQNHSSSESIEFQVINHDHHYNCSRHIFVVLDLFTFHYNLIMIL